MKRFLCVSLCLGLMVGACKKKFTQEDLDEARAEGKASASNNTKNDTTVAKKDKAAVLKACLPQINNMLVAVYGSAARNHLYLRKSTLWTQGRGNTTVVVYTIPDSPHYFARNTAFGLGVDAASVTRNLDAMAASTVIQGQFIARADDAPGFRTHLSFGTHSTNIPQVAVSTAPAAPDAGTGLTIYDRESLAIADTRIDAVAALQNLAGANNADERAGWYDCVLDEKTQNVTLKYTAAQLTAAA